MKKFRSKLPRRKRANCSPILRSALKIDPSSITDSSSNLTREPSLACDSFSRISTNNKSVKKRGFSFADGNNEFRRITRSYSKRMEALMAEKELEVSETTSCVELVNSSSKNVIQKGPEVNAVCEIENSEVETRSDVVSVTSRPKFGTTSDFKLSNAAINEGVELEAQSGYSKAKDYAESVASGLESLTAAKSGEITSYVNNSVTNEQVNDDEAENCGESKPIAAEFDLTCSEHLSGGYEECECEYSSVECTDVNIESSEVEFSSEFDTSSWYDSGSQFSERSFGDTNPSPTFQLFLHYRQQFCKSEFSAKVSSQHDDNQPSNRIITLLRPEDEEHEESYQMLKQRERRQVYLHNYAEEYRVIKEYGDLIIQQRSKMVHWIMKQSANKELQKETLFLGVSLLDRFLSKGYFRNKKELEIAGIACLTLATRIEENQPYNSIRQKYFNIGGNEYKRSEVVAMEWLVQEVLNFQCYLPTIYNFLWFYLKAAQADQHVANTAKNLALQALLGHEQLFYWPSTVAASLVCLACLIENKQSSHQQITQIRNGSNDKDLSDCIKSMEYLTQSIR